MWASVFGLRASMGECALDGNPERNQLLGKRIEYGLHITKRGLVACFQI